MVSLSPRERAGVRGKIASDNVMTSILLRISRHDRNPLAFHSQPHTLRPDLPSVPLAGGWRLGRARLDRPAFPIWFPDGRRGPVFKSGSQPTARAEEAALRRKSQACRLPIHER